MKRSRSAALALSFALGGAGAQASTECVPSATWVVPRTGALERANPTELIASAAKRAVVLLGETHDNADHHRWQLHTLAALHAQRPRMVIGFEMFPRRVQPALDRWIAGELSEREFLAQADWRSVWNLDPQLYLPLFHFARLHRIPMLALNVERALTREISQKGFDVVAEERREGVTRPAAPSSAYIDWLLDVYRQHEQPGVSSGQVDRDTPEFRRFVESQQAWDRAMAQVLAGATRRAEQPLVVGVMGSGHIIRGFGVPYQLRDLGIGDIATFVPWQREEDCKALVAGYADAVFGIVATSTDKARPRPRLGVSLESAAEGVLIRKVEKDSIAAAAGMRDGDVLIEIAGVRAKQAGDVAEAVQRQASGTWLPLRVRRDGQAIELIAKFPPAEP
jgi:uncharacterized iron-regulated protein